VTEIFIFLIWQVKKELKKVPAHSDDINAVAFADQSNQIILSGSDDTLIKVWDRRCLRDKKCVGILPGHSQGITFIDPKLDSRYLISNSKDQTIKLWDLRMIKDANFSQGRASTFEYNSYQMFGNRQFENLQRRHHKDDQSIMTYSGHKVLQTLIRCRFSPIESTGQRYIYTGSYDGTVFIYDLLSGELVHTLKGHRTTIRDVHWHPNKPLIVSTSWDGKVLKWDCEGDEIPSFKKHIAPPAPSLSSSPENNVENEIEIESEDFPIDSDE